MDSSKKTFFNRFHRNWHHGTGGPISGWWMARLSPCAFQSTFNEIRAVSLVLWREHSSFFRHQSTTSRTSLPQRAPRCRLTDCHILWRFGAYSRVFCIFFFSCVCVGRLTFGRVRFLCCINNRPKIDGLWDRRKLKRTLVG